MTRNSETIPSPTRGEKLIYVVGTYPLLTTTFIDREILQLRQWGLDVQVVSIRRPPSNIPLSNVQLDLQREVLYLLPVDVPKLFLSHLHFAFNCPRTFFGTLVYLLTRPHPGFAQRIKTFLHFGEGVYAAYLLRGQYFREFHAHFIDRAATLALVMGRLLGKPYSLSIHAAEDIFVHPILLDEKIREARHAVTCTRYNKSHLEALLGRNLDPQVSHIPHGLDLTQYPQDVASSEINHLILAVGQLVERKGFVNLIEACHILKGRGYEFQCQIIGEGAQHQTLADLIARLSLEDCVTLCGAIAHEEVVERYKKAGMLVMPCIQSADGNLDGIPNVLFEAMAMQIPVIATRISAIPELIVDDVNGMLVGPGDRLDLADAMETLIDSPQKALRLGRNGRESILAEFNIECNVRRFATTLWPEWFR